MAFHHFFNDYQIAKIKLLLPEVKTSMKIWCQVILVYLYMYVMVSCKFWMGDLY